MNKASKIFFSIFFLIILIAVAASFNKYYILKDYYITAETDCDPTLETCFIYECDPEYDGECPEDPAEGLSYYKIIEKKAYAIPLCDPENEDCPPLACLPGEDCTETLCDESTAAEGEACSNPIDYLMDQTQPVGSPDCGPADENCVNNEEIDSPEEINADAETVPADNAAENQPRDIFQPAE